MDSDLQELAKDSEQILRQSAHPTQLVHGAKPASVLNVETPLLIVTVLNANAGRSNATVKDRVAGAPLKKRHVSINKPTGVDEKSRLGPSG